MCLPEKYAKYIRDLIHKNPAHRVPLVTLLDLLRDLIETNSELRQELHQMRDFISAVPILVNSNAQAVAAVGTLATTNAQLTTDNAKLAADLAAAQANQLTPEVKAAQDAVIAASEVIQPSA